MNDLLANEAEWQLTPEEIRNVEEFENATDEDVELIQSTLSLLTLALFESCQLEYQQNTETSPK
jgi:hypothetical protein